MLRTTLRNSWAPHVSLAALLLAFAVFVLRYPLFNGYQFIGYSDRLDQYLAIAQFHVDNLRQGSFAAWSEYLLLGFDTLAQPWSFFSPSYLLPVLLNTSDVISVLTYVAVAELAAALILAYWAIYPLCRDRLATLTGACIYGFAAFGVARVATNDSTYLTTVLAPVLFRLVHDARCLSLRRCLALTGCISLALWFAFLQEFAYVTLFLFVYSVYRFLRDERAPFINLAISLTLAVLISVPRLISQGELVTDTLRALDPPRITEEVSWRTFLPFLNIDIFGSSSLEFFSVNSFNGNEGHGNHLYSSTIASLILLLVLASFIATRGRRQAWHVGAPVGILTAYIIFVFATIHTREVYLLVTFLFAKRGFRHSVIAVSAMLPIAIVSAVYLIRGGNAFPRRYSGILVGLVVALIVALTLWDFEGLANVLLMLVGRQPSRFLSCQHCVFGIHEGPLAIDTGSLLAGELVRVVAGAVLLGALFAASRAVAGFNRETLKAAVSMGIVFQSVWGGSSLLSGPATQAHQIPYEASGVLLASSGQFLPPTADQRAQLQALLDNDHYRSIAYCPKEVAGAGCINPLGISWQLRLADGYLTGVPLRLAELSPSWPEDSLEVRSLRFRSVEDLPWKALSFVNVQQAIVLGRALYLNENLHIPEDIQLIRNPSPYVYPRAYFAREVKAVDRAGARAAIQRALSWCEGCDNILREPLPADYVEGPLEGVYDDAGTPEWEGSGDRLTFRFPPSAGERFLVVNELYAPGWNAFAEGRELHVYPTNLVMRGIVVPPGSSEITLVYHSFLDWAWKYMVVVLGLMAAALYALHRRFASQGARSARLAAT